MSAADEARSTARAGEMARMGSEATGFLIGSVGFGAIQGRLPQDIGGFPTRPVLGAVAWFYASRKKRSKQGAMARGFAYATLAGYLNDLGQSFGGTIGSG